MVISGGPLPHRLLSCLTEFFVKHNPPEHIRSDNGSEFTARVIRQWLKRLGVRTLLLTRAVPGKPFKDGIDAWIYLKEIQTAIEEKEFIPWSYRGRVGSITLFENFFDKFKAKYFTYRKYFTPLLSMDLGSIDRIVVKKSYRILPDKLSQSSKNLVLQILRATLSEAYQEGLVDFIPAFPRKERAKEPIKKIPHMARADGGH